MSDDKPKRMVVVEPRYDEVFAQGTAWLDSLASVPARRGCDPMWADEPCPLVTLKATK
jgi:hypothetical protein